MAQLLAGYRPGTVWLVQLYVQHSSRLVPNKRMGFLHTSDISNWARSSCTLP